jgi:putative peptide zinc metalloprotease protein
MSKLQPGSIIRVHSFTRQQDSQEVVIGDPERGVFLALPADAVEILDALSSGMTVEEARNQYIAKYAENPDVEGLLTYLEEKGFVSWNDREDAGLPDEKPVRDDRIRYHFAKFPQGLARAIFSVPSLFACAILVGLAGALIVIEPSLLPGREALFRDSHITSMLLLIVSMGLVTTFLHEMAHLVAARARGISCRLGVGHRLWVLVAETDMTGVWSLPKSQRYLPLLAGALLDLVSASFIVVVLFGISRSWILLGGMTRQLVSAGLFIYLLRIAWQCCFFVRTDFYYVYATIFGCKNLMKDVEDFLWRTLGRWSGRASMIDQTHIPGREMRAIKLYSILWVGGRLLAFFLLFTVTLPLCLQYIRTIWSHLAELGTAKPAVMADSLAISTIAFLFTMTGLWLWVRSLLRSRRFKHDLANRPS